MISWHYIITGALLLLLFLLWKEITRENKLRLAWRLAASMFAVASLTGMAWPIAGNTDKNAAPASKEAVLITGGFSQGSVEKFLETGGENIPVYTTDLSVPDRLENLRATFVADASFFSGQDAPGIIHIFGNGLHESELQLLNPVPVTFHFPVPGPAISSVNWARKIKAGEKFSIQGTFDNPSAAEVKLFLRGLNVVSDSITARANSIQDFELHAIPKHTGRAVYALLAVSGRDTLENEPVPFEVEAPGTLKILMLASSPGFENKFLKNWLSEHGYSLTIRTSISKNKYDRQFLNTPKAPVDRLTPSYIDQFDIIIGNTGELTSISKPELEMIRSQVGRKGTGLIIMTDSAENRHTFYSRPFPLIEAKHGTQQSFVLRREDSVGKSFALTVENPVCIRYEEGTQVLLRDGQSNIFASSCLYGSGKIIITMLNNTYSLVLSGNRGDYESLWSLLLQKAARQTDAGTDWYTSPAFSYPGEPTQLHLETTVDSLPQGQAGESAVYLKQNPLLPFEWQGTCWPVQTGWQPIVSPQGPIYWWYVYQPGDWDKLLARQKINDTKKYMSALAGRVNLVAGANKEDMLHKLKLYFFLVFIFCCGFLWIEQKI